MADAVKAETTKPAATPEQKMRLRAGRTIGRGVWLLGFKEEHPTASKEDRNAAWIEVRKDFTKVGMRALKALEKNGYEVVEKPKA